MQTQDQKVQGIAKQFVQSYFNTLQTNKMNMLNFYTEQSVWTYNGKVAKGLKSIKDRLENDLSFKKVELIYCLVMTWRLFTRLLIWISSLHQCKVVWWFSSAANSKWMTATNSNSLSVFKYSLMEKVDIIVIFLTVLLIL